MSNYVDHYWEGTPAAMADALSLLGWAPEPDPANPIVLAAPVVAIAPMRTAEIAGNVIWFALVRATESMATPSGLYASTPWVGSAQVGAFAALNPVPQSLTLLQFMRQLAALSIITRDEALEAARTGVVPAAIDAVFNTFSADQAYDARLAWAGMYQVERANPVLQLVGAVHGIDGTQWDDIFTAGAAPL